MFKGIRSPYASMRPERRSRVMISLIAAVSLGFGLVPASAQSPRDEGLTLPMAVDIALKTNPLVRATASGRQMADARLEQARAARLPFVQVSETFARSNNPVFVFGSLLEQGRFGAENFALQSLNNPDPINNSRTAINFRLPVFDQRQSGTRISQALIGRSQADRQSELADQQIRFQVLQAYYGVLVARARKDVADEAVRMAEADVKRSRDLFETGVVVQSDLLAAEVQLAEFHEQQIQAEGDLVTAQAALNTALGLPVDTVQKVEGQLVDRHFEVAGQEELLKLAVRQRPDVLSAGLERQSTKEQIHGVQSELLPRVEVFGSFGVSSNVWTGGSSDYTFGASVTFNVFDAGRKARLAESRAAEAMAVARQEGLTSQVRLEVVRAYQQYAAARGRLAVAQRTIAQAEEALRIIQDRYREGLTTITEMLRAETALVRARMSLASARYDHYIGYANVLLASGGLVDVQPFVS